jgi:hypothetical protein
MHPKLIGSDTQSSAVGEACHELVEWLYASISAGFRGIKPLLQKAQRFRLLIRERCLRAHQPTRDGLREQQDAQRERGYQQPETGQDDEDAASMYGQVLHFEW